MYKVTERERKKKEKEEEGEKHTLCITAADKATICSPATCM